MTLNKLTSQFSRRMIKQMFTSREHDEMFCKIGHKHKKGLTDLQAVWYGYELAVDSRFLNKDE